MGNLKQQTQYSNYRKPSSGRDKQAQRRIMLLRYYWTQYVYPLPTICYYYCRQLLCTQVRRRVTVMIQNKGTVVRTVTIQPGKICTQHSSILCNTFYFPCSSLWFCERSILQILIPYNSVKLLMCCKHMYRIGINLLICS